MNVTQAKWSILAASLFILGHACSLDPDPGPELPEPIHSYFILYNYFPVSYDLLWEVNGYTLSAAHTYGGTILGFVNLDSVANDISFAVKNAETGALITEGNYRMEEYQFTMFAVMGTEQDPYILSDPLDLTPPSSGMIRIRFIQTCSNMDPVDVYIGGAAQERKVVDGIAYREVSGYLESSLNDLMDSVIVANHGSAPDTGSVAISTSGAGIFHPDRVYLGVIGYPDRSDTTSAKLTFYDQPVEY
ncbi:MAG TPA: hypothetical protein ENO05_12850, partial [Bacteroides sp.]|nr:hypothetical protein [Bacteroides sp.]